MEEIEAKFLAQFPTSEKSVLTLEGTVGKTSAAQKREYLLRQVEFLYPGHDIVDVINKLLAYSREQVIGKRVLTHQHF